MRLDTVMVSSLSFYFIHNFDISPDTDWDDSAVLVYPSGDVDYDYSGYVDSSYGIQNAQIYWWLRSPSTFVSDSAWRVYPSGDVYYGYVDDSYGRDRRIHSLYYNYTSSYVMEDGSMITYAFACILYV